MKLKCYDPNNEIIDCDSAAEEIQEHVYTIKVPKSIWIPSTTSLAALPIDTYSSLVVTLPQDLKTSN